VRHEAYQIALKGVTRHALGEATTNILQGKLNHQFFPAPNEFRSECNRVTAQTEIYARKAANISRQFAERKQLKDFHEKRTPEQVAQQQAVYKAYCEHWEREKVKNKPPESEVWNRVNERFDKIEDKLADRIGNE